MNERRLRKEWSTMQIRYQIVHLLLRSVHPNLALSICIVMLTANGLLYLPLVPFGATYWPMPEAQAFEVPQRPWASLVDRGRLPGFSFDLNAKIVLTRAPPSFVPDSVTFSFAYVREQGSCLQAFTHVIDRPVFESHPYAVSMARMGPRMQRLLLDSRKGDPLLLFNLPPELIAWRAASPDRYHEIYRTWNIYGRTTGPLVREEVVPIVEYFDARRQERLARYQVPPCPDN